MLYSRYQCFDLAADVLADYAHLTHKYLSPVSFEYHNVFLFYITYFLISLLEPFLKDKNIICFNFSIKKYFYYQFEFKLHIHLNHVSSYIIPTIHQSF